MEYFSEIQQYRNTHLISPGGVGSVGSTIVNTRLRDTKGDLRYANEKNSQRMGSNVQDGCIANTYGFGPSEVIDDTFSGKRRKRVSNGFRYQDLRTPDTYVDVREIAIPQYSWKSHVATTEAALTKGLRYEMPGGYAPNNIKMPRGGLYPRLVQKYTGERYINAQTPIEYKSSSSVLSTRQKQYRGIVPASEQVNL